MSFECDCSVDVDDDCAYRVCTEKIVTARKEYKCIECRDPIKIGSKYEYFKGLS